MDTRPFSSNGPGYEANGEDMVESLLNVTAHDYTFIISQSVSWIPSSTRCSPLPRSRPSPNSLSKLSPYSCPILALHFDLFLDSDPLAFADHEPRGSHLRNKTKATPYIMEYNEFHPRYSRPRPSLRLISWLGPFPMLGYITSLLPKKLVNELCRFRQHTA